MEINLIYADEMALQKINTMLDDSVFMHTTVKIVEDKHIQNYVAVVIIRKYADEYSIEVYVKPSDKKYNYADETISRSVAKATAELLNGGTIDILTVRHLTQSGMECFLGFIARNTETYREETYKEE